MKPLGGTNTKSQQVAPSINSDARPRDVVMSSTIAYIIFAFFARFTIVWKKEKFFIDFCVNSESTRKFLFYSRDLWFFLFIRVIDSPSDERKEFVN